MLSQIKNNFEMAYTSIRNPSKQKCGDHFKVDFLDDESILIATVCDGVGSRPADYLASQMVCDNWAGYFRQLPIELPIIERIKKATISINEELLSIEGNNKGLMTTLTLIVYDLGNSVLYSLNVGDSRTYIHSGSELILITKDDSKSVIVKDRGGKPLKTKDGFVLTSTGITNAIGQFGVKLNLEIFPSPKSDGICGIVLVSDGFYNCPNYEKDALFVLNELNMQEGLNRVSQKNIDYQNDDMTAVFIRKKSRNILKDTAVMQFFLQNEKQLIVSKYSLFDITESISEELEYQLKSVNKKSMIIDLFSIMEKLSIDFGRKKYIELFDLYKQNDEQAPDISRLLIQQMRSSKKP